MRKFFDSSVLVPVFYADHPHHVESARLFRGASPEDSFCALRSLAEVYATLTGLPVRPRIRAQDALQFLSQIKAKLTPVALSEREFIAAIEGASRQAITGSAVYDALIAAAALKSQSEVLLTWNVRDFVRFGPEVADLVRTPLEASNQ